MFVSNSRSTPRSCFKTRARHTTGLVACISSETLTMDAIAALSRQDIRIQVITIKDSARSNNTKDSRSAQISTDPDQWKEESAVSLSDESKASVRI